MTLHACILGATGYGGGELLRLLGSHPAVTRLDGVSRSQGGRPFHDAHPHLRGIVDGDFSDSPDWAALRSADHAVLFAAMPHGELAARWPVLWQEVEGAGLAGRLVVIDLSGDFRLGDADAYLRHYGQAHSCPEWLGKFNYGLPELGLIGDTLIANPGCFATAVQLALLPLAALPDPGLIAVAAVTGSSGSGASPSATTHHPTRAQDYRAYKLDGHQHMGEVERMFALAGAAPRRVSMVAHSAPMVRGIFVTAQFALPPGVSGEALRRAYVDAYAAAPFVRVLEGSPRVAAVVGSNFCDLSVHIRNEGAVVLVALDNLVKGMAGQAVQNMNIALGLDERTGLLQAPIFP